MTVIGGDETPAISLTAVTDMVYTSPVVTGVNWCLITGAPEEMETVVSPPSPSLFRPTDKMYLVAGMEEGLRPQWMKMMELSWSDSSGKK